MIKNALIVGAGHGLSASLARAFAANGVRVALAAREATKLGPLCDEVNASAFTCDVTHEESVNALFAALDEREQVPDLVVFNAGYYARGPIEELSPDPVRLSLGTNAFGAFLVAQAAAVRMRGSGGVIQFTGATAGVKGFANSSPFAMGKFALRGLCQSLARELGPQNIHIVHFVLDGVIYDPARGAPYDNVERSLHPDRIAETYLAAAQQHRSAWSWEIELRPSTEVF
jgi:NAD(P)-dependent dehydrogenase (short-subunit alcohol dehydrogenase family)